MQRFAALSDIHGNLHALQAVLDELDREGIKDIINCGDTLGGPLASRLTAELLMSRGMAMIAGNHERQLLTFPADKLSPSDACTASEITAEQRQWLASAPPVMWLDDDVFICHGTPSSDLHYWLETVTPDLGVNGSPGVRMATPAEMRERLGAGEHTERASLIVCGHTHVQRVAQIETNQRSITVVNPGSVGLQGYDDDHTHPHLIENGSPHARYALMTRSAHAPGGWEVQLRSVAYDFEPMARMADERGRPDWSHPLRTGFMPH
jgi:predicted phosphodiesterase